MADNVIDRAGGFGSTEQKTDNADQIRELLDQVQELMIEDGADPATAEALTNYARPASPAYAGNLADLNRMGQVAVQGSIDTPPGEPDIETSSLEDAFDFVPPAPDLNTGLQTPMGQVDAEGRAVGAEVEAGAGSGDGSDLDSMTKSELLDEAGSRGIEVSSAWTKQEIIDRINEG